ncbi:G-type lectin S-receptor-like serine/threonine-protein kinase At4g27290 isoform X1 [Malus domestica]|uniref:G-type lectin S-receptor-like serine/threonine-protein kinase At4g27290 isoform X1 n=1 Tax=Malus domestica TaxID=3750 RepID=UPI0010AB3AA3|nr:G-type lectin S-receptor-like serine/threonine-protein kinase At4g27290 [Malus domestica]
MTDKHSNHITKNPSKASAKMCLLLFYSSLLLIVAAVFSTADDATSTFQSIRDGETVVSTGGTFELGFYKYPDASNRRYVAIWYKQISVTTIVWIANRDKPLADLSGVLKVTSPGILVLNHNMSTVWSSNTSRTAQNPVARLLDSGNLVVIDSSDDDSENFLWQSFDYPGDTFLPGMEIGRNTVTGFNCHLRSWKSPQDPSQGNYTYQLGPKGYQEIFVSNGSVIKFRTGPWNGVRFSGTPHLNPNPIYTYGFVSEPDKMYYSYKLHNSSIFSRVVLTSDGLVQRYTWIDRTKDWFLYLTAQIDNCDNYAFCGVYGACNIEKSPVCSCLKGFTPKFPKEWDLVDWSDGCVRKTSLNCTGDVFQKYSGLKLPSTEQSWFNRSMNLKECQMVCMKNCSCTAYTNLDIRDGGTGCLLWYGGLIDIRYYSENGQDIYIRMAAAELDYEDDAKINAKYSESNAKKMKIIISTTVLSTGLLLLGLALLFFVWKKQHQKVGKLGHNQKEDLELPLFDLMTIVSATGNFSIENKLGEGGFGSVFKGTMEDGQEIAVKRLSKSSRQGLDEFKNEVTHIAKLQHRNLVKLLGCCIQEDEMILIYEFMPNKSLDFFIFDQRRRMLLDWPKRFEIINGIARGLLYLHQDSRLRVIHRDLKASNILLGREFNPKISDFGLARSFGGNETKAETKKVVGTYGYMSPEYAIDGFYSIKSDVYSFGVLVLEIVSGSKNRGFSHPDHKLNLLGHAWMLHTEGRPLELLDTSVEDSITLFEVVRTIHVGLLCVQRNPEDRPSMSAAVLMLSGEGALPQPLKPGFYSERDLTELEASHSSKACSANEVTISVLEAR